MAESLSTRPSLLVRIRDARNAEAWSQFVDLYAPLVYGFARKYGLQDADAADLTQEVMRAVAAAARHLEYDPQRGSFRGWLFTITRNKLRNFLTARRRHEQPAGETAQELLDQQPAREAEQEAQWELEHQRRLFEWAAGQVRGEVQESTWQAFWQTAVDGKSGREVAQSLQMSVAAVYLAKSRVMARLKQRISEAEV